jgi:hypothetical protein
MMFLLHISVIFLLIFAMLSNGSTEASTSRDNANRLPIVYVYTVVPAMCKYGMPSYIVHSLEQAIFSQPDCDVIMTSNYHECSYIEKNIKHIPQLIMKDASLIASPRTKEFANLSTNILAVDYGSELWLTSALRFFILEDLMITQNYTELVHVEADNLLYGRFTSILPALRSGYPSLAATPLTSHKVFVTASVFWINNLQALQRFNDYLLALAKNTNNQWKGYLTWIRPYGCCKAGGVDPDENGQGIKPFAINEMSMLGHYHHILPNELKLFPLLPSHNFIKNKHICNLTSFAVGGEEVGPATGSGVWDPNSWGQYLGGTSRHHGNDRKFTDSSHVIGQAIRVSGCFVKMLCRQDGPSSSNCVTAPNVKCGDDRNWTPLWNLHVHSKNTKEFMSQSCSCPTTTAP